MPAHKVFVSGATGTVGSTVARQLRALEWEVHTTTRNTDSPAAQTLASIGVKVHPGSWTDPDALEAAMAGCDLLFLILMPDLADMASELVFGKVILRVAKAAGVKQVVYSAALMPPGIDSHPMMHAAHQSKKLVAAEIQNAGFQYWTVLQPGYFMANLLAPKVNMMYPGATETGLFVLAFTPEMKLPMVDTADIATFAVAAFQNPDKFHGKTLGVVSEIVTVERAIETLRRATGRNIRAKYLKDEEELEEAKKSNPFLFVQEVLRDNPGFGAQAEVVEEGERLGFELGTFERFVQREREALEETYQKV